MALNAPFCVSVVFMTCLHNLYSFCDHTPPVVGWTNTTV